MSKQQDIRAELPVAMKARDAVRVNVLRRILSAFTNELVAKSRGPQGELSDDEVLAIIKKMARQQQDSIEQFTKGGRVDLVENEKPELEILQAYLPEEMSVEEITKIATAKKAEMGVTDKTKMGILMGAVMKEAGSRADGNIVKEVVSKLFD